MVALYVLGVALVYATLGLVAGLTGSIFGGISTNKWALLLMANLLLVSGLALLDVFTMQVSSGVLAWAGRFGADRPYGRLHDGRDLGTGRRSLWRPGVRRRAHLRRRHRQRGARASSTCSRSRSA